MSKKSKNRYRALFISDTHMRNDWPHSTTAQGSFRTDRFEDQLKLWKIVADSALKYKCEAIYCLGDLFDESLLDPVTLAGTIEALKQTSRAAEIWLMAGNHDEHKPGSFQTDVFAELESESISLLPHASELPINDWLSFWPFHYRRAGVESELEAAPIAASVQNVALIHQSIKGCSHLGWVCEDGMDTKPLERFDYTLAGHFHTHQYFIPKRGMYLSSPMHHHFGDVGRDAFFWVIEFRDKRPWVCKPISPNLPRFRTFDWDDDFEADPGDVVRILVRKTPNEISDLKEKMEEVRQSLREAGIRGDVKPVPIYHHGARLEQEESDLSIVSVDDMVEPYVGHPNVATEGLDAKKLISIGRGILGRARAEID